MERPAEGYEAAADAAFAERRLEEAVMLYDAALAETPGAFAASWKAARADVEWLDVTWKERIREERIALAQSAIAHADAATAAGAGRPEGHYYRAIGYGLLGKAKGLGGRKTVQPIIDSAERVIAIDPSFAGAGAHRVLGALYQKAPAWPASVGDIERSRQELETACRLAPDVPENHLFLARTLAELGEEEEARRALQRYRELIAAVPEAERARLWGEEEREVEEALGR